GREHGRSPRGSGVSSGRPEYDAPRSAAAAVTDWCDVRRRLGIAMHRVSDEQHAAIDHVTTEARIAAIVGRAGAGKTTTMKAARDVWETAGYRVVGAALAGKAAVGLEAEAGIRSGTLAAWELRWTKRRDLLDTKTVFVLDEAAILQWHAMIASAGGYLRSLTRKAEEGGFSLGPMLMALIGSRKHEKARA
ncbi:MAG: AAA family ATPase, partial [Phyllobacteriaceae bacterium]|nr:AAA family ATPase [Phyllobacteriaceae bacterium]